MKCINCKNTNLIKIINFLDFFDYNKFSAENELAQNFQFKKYKNKHYESVFTRF